jgi:hypothetical protein
MIREFFEPRVFGIFILLWILCWAGTLAFIHATKRERTVPCHST